MIVRNVLLALFVALGLVGQAHAASPARPLFASDEPIKITIQGPIAELMRNRSFTGTIDAIVTDNTGNRLPAKLALRGITRRASETCDFAPLKLDFVGHPPAGSVFDGQNKLKLVTHCRANADFQQNVLLEYAAYRLFNFITPQSMRARLVTVDYRDSGGRPIVSRLAFFLEDTADLAARNGLRELRATEKIPVDWLQPAAAARYALFQDMISNHDWSMRAGPAGDECCHNARLIGTGSPGQTIPVPYDFDFSGLVSAPYATTPDVLPIANVRQRLYRGYCKHSAEALAAARQMRANRASLLAVLDTIPDLQPRKRDSAKAFLGQWFDSIGTDEKIAARLKRCL